jgi:hypothetical protein
MSTPLTLDRETVGWLVSGSLTHLWYASPDAYEPGDADGEAARGCCPRCCLPCGALKRLLDAGQLDELAALDEDGNYLWDDERQRVDRDWLRRAWTLTECHEGPGGAEG